MSKSNHGRNRPVLNEMEYLKRFVELERQAEALKEDRKSLAQEAKEDGHNVRVLRAAAKRSFEPADKRDAREETEEAIDRLIAALGEFVETPLGAAAMRAVDFSV